jgi:hypothetical protein
MSQPDCAEHKEIAMLKRLLLLAALLAAGWLTARRLRPQAHELPPLGPLHYQPPRSIEPRAPALESALPAAPPPEAAEQAAPPAAHESAGNTPGGVGEIEGYCMRCRTRRTMAGVSVEITESGRRGARGTCPVCGVTMFKFLPSEA